MNDITIYLVGLGVLAGIVAAIVAGLQRWTTFSTRTNALVTLALGPCVGVLLHYSGFLELAVGEPKNTILSAAWGLVASMAGAGISNANLLHAVKPPAEGGGS